MTKPPSQTSPQSSKTNCDSKDPCDEEKSNVHQEHRDSLRDDAIEETPPQTVKDLFSVFAPEDSASDEDDTDPKQDIDNCEPPAKKAKDQSSRKYIPKYKKEWEAKPELKPWLSGSIHGNTYFYCKFCKKDYRCGISDINKHMTSKKHMLRAAMPAFQAQKFKFRGLLCPVFTPFTNTKRVVPEINVKSIQKYSNFLKACNIKGILINDVMGEGMSLSIAERIEVTDLWVSACEKNNQFLMVQIGGACLKEVLELAKHASKKDVGAVVILPDLYNKPKNHLDVIKYLKLISEYTQKVPILYHHHPKFTNVEIDVTSFLLEITGEVDSFVGLIYTTNDIQQSMAALSVNREKYTVFMGTDEAILAAVASGFTCIMGASLNFLPKLVESICSSVKSGNLKTAQASQTLLNKTMEVTYRQGEPVAALKAATDILTSTCGTLTREPLPSIWEGTIKKMQAKFKEMGVV